MTACSTPISAMPANASNAACATKSALSASISFRRPPDYVFPKEEEITCNYRIYRKLR